MLDAHRQVRADLKLKLAKAGESAAQLSGRKERRRRCKEAGRDGSADWSSWKPN